MNPTSVDLKSTVPWSPPPLPSGSSVNNTSNNTLSPFPPTTESSTTPLNSFDPFDNISLIGKEQANIDSWFEANFFESATAPQKQQVRYPEEIGCENC